MSARLIINADDYGYFPAVSAGIVEAIGVGVVTATGVMANGPAFERCAEHLRELPEADAGVHLNATYGAPLSRDFPHVAGAREGQLPDTRQLVAALLSGRLPVVAVEREWRAQIERCRAAGLALRFVNSHEHVHMFPLLYSVVIKLARESGIEHIRYTHPEWSLRGGAGGITRALAMRAFGMFIKPSPETPRMLGLAPSGRLDLAYFASVLPTLRGGTYELMCHPGRVEAVADPRLRDYHDWNGELRCLTSKAFRDLLRDNDITLTRFRDLQR